MKKITRTDINPFFTAIIASSHEIINNRHNYKRIKAVHDFDTGITKFVVEAQYQPNEINTWKTVCLSYTNMQDAINKYNEVQF